MFRLLTKFLLFTDILLLVGCASAYKNLKAVHADPACLQKFEPHFGADWYNAKVDVIGKHISGLLLIKTMPDSSVRTVFTNEAGIKFFDFEFRSGAFKVYDIIHALDKRPVVTTLRKDFELILMRQTAAKSTTPLQSDEEIYYAFPEKKETVFFVTNKDCSTLLRVERGSKRKKKAAATLVNQNSAGIPDSMHIQHFTFNMQISMKKLEKE
jgi:hypothetical protein